MISLSTITALVPMTVRYLLTIEGGVAIACVSLYHAHAPTKSHQHGCKVHLFILPDHL